MAEKKKAYRRFEELTRRATAPMPDESGRDRSFDEEHTGSGSASEEVLVIRLSPEVRRALEQRAVAEHTTPSEIVQEALRRYLPRFPR